jgi:hypothetical protein
MSKAMWKHDIEQHEEKLQAESTQTPRKGGRQYVGTVDGAADPVHFGLPDHLVPHTHTLTVASRGRKSCIRQVRDAEM